jgi:hypothetical protein
MSWSWLGFPIGFMPFSFALVPGEHGGESFASGCRRRPGASRVTVIAAETAVLQIR